MSDNLLKVSQSDNSLIASNRVATSAAVISPKTKINSQSEIKNSTSIQSNANTPVSSSLISAICKTTTLLKSGVTTGVAHTTDPVYPPVVSDDPDTTPSKFIPKGPGGISTDPDTPVIPALPVQPTIKNVYGASIDIQNAKRILGTSIYNYIETDTDGFVLPTFTSNDIILGGVGTQGGIGNVDLNGAIRLAGSDRTGTINAIRNYAGVKNVYGASKDLENAEKILGDYGYNYIHTDALNFQIPQFTSNDIIVGGTGAIGGIGSGIQLNGAIRLAGANEQLTAQVINNYNSPKYVYGNTIDIQNAENILGDTGYTYINTDDKNFHKSEAYTSNDIILGGSTCTGITDDELNGAIRLAGATREDTANLVRNYSISKNVYGASIDLQNANRILGTVGYNYIETDKSGFIMPKFTENDIIIGGTGTIGGIGDVNLNGATRLAGTDRDGTIQAIRNSAGTKRVYGTAVDIASAANILGNTNFTYIVIDPKAGTTDTLTSNDIVLGGLAATGINDNQLNGAIRLAGANRALTAQAIYNYNTPKYVYGNSIDIGNAKTILGNTGYDYITIGSNFVHPTFNSDDIVLGGSTVTGIADSELNDATRLTGANRDETAQLIKNYSVAMNIYGASADIDNVKGFLGTTGYNYIYTDKSGFVKPNAATYNDVLLGGVNALGGIGNIPSYGAARLEGANRDLTAMAVWDHFGINGIPSQSWGAVNRDPSQMYVNATVDGTGAAISIAKGTTLQVYGSDGDYYDCYYSGTNGVKILKMYLTKCNPPTPVSPTPGTGGGSILSQVERFCSEPITSTWGISDDAIEQWYLSQSNCNSKNAKYNLNAGNIRKVTNAVRAAGVSPVFFYIYSVNEGSGGNIAGGFINHFAPGNVDTTDLPVSSARQDANYLAQQSNKTNSSPATGGGEPADMPTAAASALLRSFPAGSIGIAYIPSTSACTAEIEDLNGITGDWTGLYGNPLQTLMNKIKALGGNPLIN